MHNTNLLYELKRPPSPDNRTPIAPTGAASWPDFEFALAISANPPGLILRVVRR